MEDYGSRSVQGLREIMAGMAGIFCSHSPCDGIRAGRIELEEFCGGALIAAAIAWWVFDSNCSSNLEDAKAGACLDQT